MRILIAPDKFKGSLDAIQVARQVGLGLSAVLPNVRIEVLAVADGGEGTLDAAIADGFTEVPLRVTGPVGERVASRIGVGSASAATGRSWAGDRVAVVEMAAASGLALLPTDSAGAFQLAALTATSKGTGELIIGAMDAQCSVVILGVGGSACTDGGAGMLEALGARLLDRTGNPVPGGGGGLRLLDRVDLAGLDPRIVSTRFILASDVTNPLTGAQGAAFVFGPQKGATASEVTELDVGLANLRDKLTDVLGPRGTDLALAPGAGAAGGVGYAAMAVLNAERAAGIDVVLDLVGLAERVEGAGLVITGEGSLDHQSLGGKTPIGVARMAQAAGVPVVAVCGKTTLTSQEAEKAGFTRVYPLTGIESDVERCIREAGPLLEQVGAAIGRDLPQLVE